MKTMKTLLIMTCSLPILLSCSDAGDLARPNSDEEIEIVNMIAEQKPIKLTQEQKTFANDNNQFTLNFLKRVNETDRSGKSFIYSPLSITYVLGMVNDAAEGETRKELEQTLGFHEGGIKAVNEYCKTLIEGLPKVDEGVQLNIANAIFVNKNYTLKEQFQQDMQTYYDAKAEALDFFSPQTLSQINGWCKEKTKGMIPSILEEVNPNTASYLLNAIYFKADWTSAFDEKNTKTESFTTEHGKVQLPLMHQKVIASYMKNDIYSAVTIPYTNGLWNMVVMLPQKGKTTDDIIIQLAANGWSTDYSNKNPLSGAQNYEVDLKLPRFETSSDTDDFKDGLIGLLKPMGIQRIFNSNSSQAPNMCEQGNIFIDMMRQKAIIKVNEKGAEAAAVTVAGARVTSVGPIEYPKAEFHANRPFVYVIREASSGVLLFVGKYTGE